MENKNDKKHPPSLCEDECIKTIDYLLSKPSSNNFTQYSDNISNIIENYLTYRITATDKNKIDFHRKIVQNLLDAIVAI